MVYVPVATEHIVIVTFIRQSRDVPAILKKYDYLIRHELKEIQEQLATGKLVIK
jgi:low affinity Fe/Cu permease